MHRHAQNKRSERKQRFVEDSKTWMEFDNRWTDFSQDPFNMWFGLALDGVNPFSY